MARTPRLTDHELGKEPPQPETEESPAAAVAAGQAQGHAGTAEQPAAATRKPRPTKSPSELWADGLGRVGIRAAQVLLILTVAVVSVYALMQIKLLVIPILIALILAAAIGPFVNMLRRRGLRGGLATGIAFIGLLLVLGGVFTVIYLSVRNQWGELAQQAASGLDELEKFLLTGPIPIEQEQLDQARQGIVEFATSSQVRSGAITGLSVVTEFFAGAALMIVILFFFLKDGAKIWNFFLRPFSGAREAKLRRVGSRTLEVLGGYVRGTAIVALVDTVAIGAALLIMQVPLALPLAIIVFIGAFIPLVGATVAGILAALVALVANGPVVALIVVAVVIAVNQLEGDLLQPIVMGKSLQLHALVILMALTAGTILAGIVGAVLSVPLAAVAWAIIQVWTAEDPNLEDMNPNLPPAGTKPI
ncbi:AI-2E family transporter [Pseudarthrobacter phenanthrenivorans]|uniref:AI-2E family transporter n=2 Tax=Pseudarthrobacter phenanthrenivorans TaxID=361575 RepID=A0A3B0G0G6_PSEPS|nr:AI-2E family transporter [Pseudarthrobacter phenanthrenivorans]ADX74043.1 putative permease [Pseudarthrobacter phenanthrenivorans Sphe3]RKO25428.1 AI-2E family transporter [Pseudarthrobacter phenanthrenivorans]